jgi:hypothetical protein
LLIFDSFGQARQFIETFGTQNLFCGRKFVYFWASLLWAVQKINILMTQYKQISDEQKCLFDKIYYSATAATVWVQQMSSVTFPSGVNFINILRAIF